MPLFKLIKPNAHTTLYIWKIEESLADLKQGICLVNRSQARVNKMKSELHQRGFLSVRHLLKEAGYADVDLYYNSYGKPLLKDGKHISITHSYHFSAIALSDDDIGIDIEMLRNKIKIIQHKFVNTDFDTLTDEDLVKQLTVIWGAKEAMYKIYPYGGLSFRDHIAISPFLFKEGQSSGRIHFNDWKKKYTVHFFFIENAFACVYAMPQKN
jgi:4'-phosphopantetheinyl transferase